VLTPPPHATVTTVREQASEEQQSYWLPRILNYDVIGCYAQTELGHGSNVRGLETTATWDPARKDFEIHSPYLTSSKWWNGSMGRTATHAVCHTSALSCTTTTARLANLDTNYDRVHRLWLHNCYCLRRRNRSVSPTMAHRRLSYRFGTRSRIFRFLA
jgi:hypothetical protein